MKWTNLSRTWNNGMAHRAYDGKYDREIEQFAASLEALQPDCPFTLVLIGSVARGTETAKSDIDVLAVGDHALRLPQTPARFHVQTTTMDALLKKLAERDDFSAWCVRYGVPLCRAERWEALRRSDEAQVWPDWRRKVAHAFRRLTLAARLRELGDDDAAGEEMLYSLGHVARGLLLRADVFPLSRAELIDQVCQIGFKPLSNLIEGFIYAEDTSAILDQAQWYAKKILCSYDREGYNGLAIEFAKTNAAKRDRKAAATS